MGIGLTLVGMGLADRCPAAETKAPAASPQKACDLDRTVQVKLKYLLYLPPDYSAKPAWPLLLFLHGAGERGANLDAVKKHGPPKLIDAGQSFPFIVVSPQCPADRWWDAITLTALLDEIVERYKVDRDRIYVTGLSMGGFGTWALAAYTPQRFAAIAPVCGGGEPYWARTMGHLPVWIFHGGKDGVVPLARSEQMHQALKKTGADVKLTVYPDAGHDSWTATYANPELYQWLLAHQRAGK
jgi:predicted peptidase